MRGVGYWMEAICMGYVWIGLSLTAVPPKDARLQQEPKIAIDAKAKHLNLDSQCVDYSCF